MLLVGPHQARPHARWQRGRAPRLPGSAQAVPRQGRAAHLAVLAPPQADGQLHRRPWAAHLLGQAPRSRLPLRQEGCGSAHARGAPHMCIALHLSAWRWLWAGKVLGDGGLSRHYPRVGYGTAHAISAPRHDTGLFHAPIIAAMALSRSSSMAEILQPHLLVSERLHCHPT